METMIQPKVTGYRQLSEAEVALMNEGKALAELCGAYIAKLRTHPQAKPEQAPAPGSFGPRPGSAGCAGMSIQRGIALLSVAAHACNSFARSRLPSSYSSAAMAPSE